MCGCAASTCSVRPVKSSRRLPHCLSLRLLLVNLLWGLITTELSPANCVLVSEFFPFGTQVNDNQTVREDDGGSEEIRLAVIFPFFGQRHDKIYVNNNGVISFVDKLSTYTPENFPLTQAIPIIAPFWADVDIRNSSGTVWYRETNDSAMLAQATREIVSYSSYKNFKAYWVFISTWDDVGFYGAQGKELEQKNTFQAVLTLDKQGKQSFVILNYAKIQWITGSNSQGSSAQAGFNAGDKVNSYEIDGARTPSVVNLTQISNVGIPGKWIFRIDTAEIQDVCSQAESGPVQFQPSFTSMLGGEGLSVVGLCFDSEVPSLRGRLELENGREEEMCCLVEGVSTRCYLPIMFQTGVVNISISVNNLGWNYRGQVEIKNIVQAVPDVVRLNPDKWWPGNNVSVKWSQHFYESSASYRFDVLTFQNESTGPSLLSVFNTTLHKNSDRVYTFQLPASLSNATLAIVRVTPMSSNCSRHLTGPSIFSDVFPVRYANALQSDEVCKSWLSQQSNLAPVTGNGSCPCTLSQAEGDTASYTQDPLCAAGSEWFFNCKYRSQFASQCIIPNQSSQGGGMFVCCYEKTSGELLIAFEGQGGGTRQRYHIDQEGPGVVPYFTYMQEEVAPYLACYQYSNNTSLNDGYLKSRPPVDCRGYHPPAAAQAAGDPHMVTLDNLPYTFNGVGDFTLLRVKDTDATVQVRAVPTRGDRNEPQNATVFSAIAIRASNSSSVLEIRLRTPAQDYVSIFKDSEPLALTTNTSQLSEMTIYLNKSQNSLELTVVLEQLGLSILVQATEDLLNILVMAGSQLKGRLEGLLGNYNGNKSDDLRAKDGTVLDTTASMREIHFQFGMSWLVSDLESIFTNTSDTDFDMANSPSTDLEGAMQEWYVPVFKDEINQSALPSDVLQVCGVNQDCQFDYLVTGKKSIALSTKLFNERYEARRNDVSEVVRCPYVVADAIKNGNRNLTGLMVGATVTVTCDSGFESQGPSELTCEENGEWNSAPPTCIRVDTGQEFPLIPVATGAAVAGFLVLVVLVAFAVKCCRKCSTAKLPKSLIGSDFELATELPILFQFSDIPTPVFDNSLFVSSLQKLCDKGGFHIPRPTFVDPTIYSDFF